MTLTDFLRVFWRRKVLIALVTAAVIGLAYGATKLVSKQYESTSTLSISPRDLSSASLIPYFGTLDAIVPIYADAATARVDAGRWPSSVSVAGSRASASRRSRERGS